MSVPTQKLTLRKATGALLDLAFLPAALLHTQRDPVVFIFHSVNDEQPFMMDGSPGLAHPVERFRGFVSWLADRARVIRLEELVVNNGRPRDDGTKPTVALTFDDGFRDNYSTVLPVLRANRMTATFFLTLAMIGTSSGLTVQMIREMASAGMDFGSHGLSHRRLPRMRREHAREEISESKCVLERLTGLPIRGFAYPFGAFDDFTRQEVQEAGYSYAVAASLNTSFADRFTLPRTVVLEKSYFYGDYARLYGAQRWRHYLGNARRLIEVPGMYDEETRTC